MHRLLKALAGLSLIAVIGCGGSGSGSGTPGPDQGRDVGALSLRYRGNAQTMSPVGGGNVTVMGVSGAEFNEIRVRYPLLTSVNADLARDLSPWLIVRNDYVYMQDPSSGLEWDMFRRPIIYLEAAPTLTWNGSKVMYSQQVGSSTQLYQSNVDGTNEAQLTNEALGAYAPDYSSNGTKAVFNSFDGVNPYFRVKVLNLATNATTFVGPDTMHCFLPRWSPDGTKIAFLGGTDPSDMRMHVMNADGSSVTQIPQFDKHCVSVDWVTNTTLVGSQRTTDGFQLTLSVPGSFHRSLGAETPTPPTSISASPDGTMVGYVYEGDVYPITLSGGAEDQITNDGEVDFFSWGPYTSNRVMVGSGGPMGSSVAGCLFSQMLDVVPAFVSFDAQTRSTATITKEDSGSTNVVIRVEADKLTSLDYVGPLFAPRAVYISPAQPSTHAKGAFVSFNAITGRVASVVTYASASLVRGGGYEGQILGVWDAKGKNLAPDGARAVTFEPSGEARVAR